MNQVDFLNLEYFFNLIVEFFRGLTSPAYGVGGFFAGVGNFLVIVFSVILPVGILVLIVLWVYYQIRIVELRRLEKDKIYARLIKKQQEIYVNQKNARWEQIEALFNSASPGDWRLAIIEADSMLEDLIVQLGYPGDNLGERMKSIDRGDFPMLDAAWEAHLVRNKIAHEGLAYDLTEREKRRVHSLYKQIFESANFI